MDKSFLSEPDVRGIIVTDIKELGEVNKARLRKFGAFMFLYDFFQDRFIRPNLHHADPLYHKHILTNTLTTIPGTRILDVACGTGAAIELLSDQVNYTGLDLSYSMLKQAVRKAEKWGLRNARFIQGTAEDLPFEEGCFDTVLIDTALHMIPDWKKAIWEAARVLSPAGTFVCSVPAVGLVPAFDSKWAEISGPRNLHSIEETELVEACSRAGLNYSKLEINGALLYFTALKKGR